MRQIILMLVLMSLTLSAKVKTYKDHSTQIDLSGNSFNYIVKPQIQKCEPLWEKNNSVYQIVLTEHADKAIFDFLNHQKADPDIGLRVISKPMIEIYEPDVTLQNRYLYTILYVFDSLEDCEAALPTIRKEAVELKKKAKEISAKRKEK